MRFLSSLIIALILTACGGTQQPARPGYAAQKDATVEVTTLCSGVGGGSGTGVVVDQDRILTAYHVIECTGRAYIGVNFHGGDVVLARVEFISVDDDLAQLKVEGANFTPGRVRFGKPPGVGDVVCYSAAVPRWERVCGPVIGVTASRQGNTVVKLDSTPGNSGSGVYNLIGELVGIHQVNYRSAKSQGGFKAIRSIRWPGRN